MRLIVVAGTPICLATTSGEWRSSRIAGGQKGESGHGAAAVVERVFAAQCRRHVWIECTRDRFFVAVIDQWRAIAARDEPVVGGARILDDKPAGIGVTGEEVSVDLSRTQQFVDQREDEQAVGARPDADPFVGDRRITGADRIDRDDLGAAFLQLADADLDRIGIVILGDAEQHEVFGMLPVRLAELPERAADRVHAAGGHVDRAEAAVRGVIGRAELRRPPAGERLRLIAPGEEGELLRIGRANVP